MNRKNKNTARGMTRPEYLTRRDYLGAATLTISTLAIYAFTAAPGVTMEDSGDFIMGALTLGIVHAPGYPLYTMLGHLFTYFPLGDPAFRVNLFSSILGAICLGVMFLNLRILAIGPFYAAFATLSLGFTTVFWSKTAVAEVYSFNALFLALIVFWLLSYNRDKRKWQFYLVALTTGLALSNHYPLVIVAGAGLVLLLDRKGLGITDYLKGSLLLALGLIPYLYLVIQAYRPDLDYSMGKVSDLRMVLDHILRRQMVDEMGGSVFDKFYWFIWFLKATVTDFLASSIFIICGLAVGFSRKWKFHHPFLLAALSTSLGLILVLPLPRGELYGAWLSDFIVPAFLFFSIYLALGSQTLLRRYVADHRLQALLLVTLLVTQMGFNFRSASHHNDRLAEVWGTELLNSLEPDSVLIFCMLGQLPIYYLQLVKGIRSDVTLYDRFSFFTKQDLYGEGKLRAMKNARDYRNSRERDLIEKSDRPVYYLCKFPIDELKVSFSYTPFVLRADKRHQDASQVSKFDLSDRLLDALVNGYPKGEYWLTKLKERIFSRLIVYYGSHKSPELDRVLTAFRQSGTYADPPSLLSLANDVYYFKNYDLAGKLYARVNELDPEAFNPIDLAVYCNILANSRDYDQALRICQRQEKLSPPCEDNTVSTRQTIAAVYKEKNDWPKVRQYARKILECRPGHEAAQNLLELSTPTRRQ